MKTIRTIALAASSALLLAGCVIGEPAPVTSAPRSPAVCEALRPAFPIKELSYDSKLDTKETVADVRAGNLGIRKVNARFKASCP